MNIPPKYEDVVAQLEAAKMINLAGEHVESHLEKQIDILRIDLDAALAREAALWEELDRFKRDAEQDTTIDERDRYHEIADSLALAISQHFRVEIGEHSSMNCPWDVALDVMNGAYVTDTDEGRERDALQQRLTDADQLLREVSPMVAKKPESPWFLRRGAALKPAEEVKS